MRAQQTVSGGVLVKALVLLFLLMGAAFYVYLAPWYLAPYREARVQERANKDLAAELRQLKRETQAMENRSKEPKDRWEAERRLREKGYVRPGEVLIRGPGIGAAEQ